jgi:hypothetical protein
MAENSAPKDRKENDTREQSAATAGSAADAITDVARERVAGESGASRNAGEGGLGDDSSAGTVRDDNATGDPAVRDFTDVEGRDIGRPGYGSGGVRPQDAVPEAKKQGDKFGGGEH